ncbi:MAG: hypothetical protein IB616_01750 [Methanosarcinales archaeon]|nr:MAG: hypothetical protein IB616_01750 [Methanosarcinales archaeon]
MNKWKIGAILGAIWGLLGAIFLSTVVWQWGSVISKDTTPSYIKTIYCPGKLVFAPIFVCIVVTFIPLHIFFQYMEFPSPLSNSLMLILFPIYGALIGAGIGYLIDKYRR